MNNPPAFSLSPSSAPPVAWQAELKHIGRELQHMSEELRREMELEDAQNELEEELTSANDRISALQSRLESERSEKQRLQNLVESFSRQSEEQRAMESNGFNRVHELEDQIRARQSEIDALRDEKKVMKEWLDRGVMECQRVAAEVARLSSEVNTRDKSMTELMSEKANVSDMMTRLNAEVQEAQRELQRVRHEKAVLEGRVEDRETRVHISEEQMKGKMVECDRLAGEVSRLGTRVRDLEDTEIAMAGVAASMRRLAFELQHLNADVQRNAIQTAPEDMAGFYETEGTGGSLREAMTVTKSAAAGIQDGLVGLRSALKSKMEFDDELRKRMEEELKSQADMFSTEAARLKELHDNEVGHLRERICDLEAQLGIYNEHTVSARRTNVSVSDSIMSENIQLRERCEKLEAEHSRLKDKVKRLKIDWTKVDETRHRYRQLERERDMLRDGVAKIEAENIRLREYLASVQYGTGSVMEGGSRSPLMAHPVMSSPHSVTIQSPMRTRGDDALSPSASRSGMRGAGTLV